MILSLLAGCGLSDSVLHLSEGSLGQGLSQELDVLETQAPLFTDGDPVLLWGRSQLSDRDQAIYDRFCQAIGGLRETPLLVDGDADTLERILYAIHIDHPEYFWFNGEAAFVTKTLGQTTLSTECSFTYTMDQEQAVLAHTRVRDYTDRCLASVAESGAADDYQKILAVYRYLIENTVYDLESQDQSPVDLMTNGRANCAGYARAFQYLLHRLEIPCILATGVVGENEAHGWNYVLCDGAWYQTDVTWGDPAGEDSVLYTYCMVPDEEIQADHTPDRTLTMPVCSCTDNNYFVREGLLFSDCDPVRLRQAMAEQEGWFSFRLATDEAYESAVQTLFREGQIWDIMRQAGLRAESQVIYSLRDPFREISVRLEKDTEDEEQP